MGDAWLGEIGWFAWCVVGRLCWMEAFIDLRLAAVVHLVCSPNLLPQRGSGFNTSLSSGQPAGPLENHPEPWKGKAEAPKER